METTEYTVDYFIKFYEAIPYDQWITQSYTRLINGVACHCALGHLGVFCSDQLNKPDVRALIELFITHLKLPPNRFYENYMSVVTVNDADFISSDSFDPEVDKPFIKMLGHKHPKDRILAALKLIKEKISQA